jgi:hypothetical protein
VINPYAPPDVQKFTLVSGPPGASVDSESGVLSWHPSVGQISTNIPVTVRVSDTGTPPFFDEQQFWLLVRPPQEPGVSLMTNENGHFTFHISGDTNLDYTVLASTNLVDWTEILKTNAAVSPFKVIDSSTTNFSRRFYKVEVGE